MKKILVLGSTGMAGHIIYQYLKEKLYDVYGLSRKNSGQRNNIVCDVTNTGLLKSIIEDGKFDVIVNCIGLLNSDAENNKSKAVYLNGFLPHYLVEVTKSMSTRIIHMSTDCVFSGIKGNYIENDFCDGKSFYDRTKAIGEINDTKNLTFRNSIIGPDISENGIGLFNWFMKQSGEINGYDSAIWTGVTTLTLAKAIEVAIESNLIGLYHLVNNDKITKYELCKLFNKHFRNNKLIINKTNDVVLNKSLINNRKDFCYKVPSYEDMIIEMKQWVYNHKEMYPYYYKE